DSNDGVTLFQAQNGVVFLTVNGAEGLGNYRASFYDMTGNLCGQHIFNGATTAVNLPVDLSGVVVVVVEGDYNFRATAKAILR
ncbi:MAG: hypothetical protein J1E63_04355, partial [Muribaculaceae bacterium]|nr:hypothetical protein [Muribaculaceae bacterium]